MKDHRKEFSIERMASVLSVSRSGYYAWLSRPESSGKKQQRALDSRVKVCFKTSKERSGSPKIYNALKQEGFRCSRSAVARSMRHQGSAPRRDGDSSSQQIPNIHLLQLRTCSNDSSRWTTRTQSESVTLLICGVVRVVVSDCLSGSVLTSHRWVVAQ